MKRSRLLAALAAAALLFAPGCAPDRAPGTLRMAVTEFPRSLDPADGYASWDLMRLGAGECLTRFDRSMTPQPWLAERWTLSPDRLTWTFHLRPGLRFSNGKPLTAEAARASLLRLFGRSVRAHSFFEPAAITADGLALSIRTTRPAPNLPGLLADPLFLLIDVEDAGDIRRTGPVTTGPYRLVSASGDVLRLEANPWYHEGPPPFRRVEAPLVPDPGAAAMTLQTGEADLLPNAGPENLVLFRDAARYHISETATLRSVLARFHAAPGRPLADPRVRAALIAACDRKTYCEVLLDGSFLPGGPAVPPSMDCGFEELADPNPYDPARAARLLDEAGWTDTDGDGIRDKDGRPLALTFLTYPDRPYLPALAEAVQADARAAGIRIDIEVLDYNVLVSRGKEGTWDLLATSILTGSTGDPEVYLNRYWKSGEEGNITGWSSAEYDALSDELASTFDPARRRALLVRMQQILLDDAAALVFGYPKSRMVSAARIAGAEITPADYYWITDQVRPAQKS